MEGCYPSHQRNAEKLIHEDKVGISNYKTQNYVPTRMEKMKLQKASLGRRRISFHKDSNAISVKAKLEEVYPPAGTWWWF